MKLKWPENPLVKSLIIAIIVYLLWYIAYDLIIHPAEVLDDFVVANSVDLSKFLLNLLGYETFQTARSIGTIDTMGLTIGDSCNAIPIMAIFAGFIIAFPGDYRKKIIFISAGILAIHLLNVLRICALCLILSKAPEAVDFNHTYTFTLLMYGCIFLFWMYWVKWAKVNLSQPED